MGHRDFYLSAVKGAIVSQCPDASIIDISHDIAKHDVAQASFIIKNAYPNFPKDSIHIIGVNPETTTETSYLAVYANGHYFIGPDNGIFSLIFDVKPDLIVELNISHDTDYLTFPTKDLFVKAACHIARGGTLEVIGKIKDDFLQRSTLQPVVEGNLIRGNVIYIDSYQNAFTNITEKLFMETAKGRNFQIDLGLSKYTVHKIRKSYNEVPDGEILALFSSTGHLEFAINKGSVKDLLDLQLLDMIRVEFN